MKTNDRAARPRTWTLLALTALMLAALAGVGHAQGGPGGMPPAGPPAAQPADPALYWGAKFFNDAVQWVARGRPAIPQVRDFYASLDARLELDTSRHEGRMRLWFLSPSMYRQELMSNNATTTKILSGDLGWLQTPAGRLMDLNRSTEGQQTIRQMKDDRERLSDLSHFLTLEGLKGPNVTFRFDGYKQGSGTYAGDWIKITRTAPDRSQILFWFAYEKNGDQVQATWPGVVRVEGDPARDYPTEDYILKEWDSPLSQQQRDFRYPRRIEAYSILTGTDGQPRPTRFLFAIVDDIQINTGMEPSIFQPTDPGAPR